MTDVRTAKPVTAQRRPTLLQCFAVQRRVIGAIIMRELHTRYGRENIGYLWLIIEPLIYGSAIALLHGLRQGTGEEGGISPIASGVMGYSIFIIFRGVVGRADSALSTNMALLHHKMVTVFDICVSRNLLELAGCVCAFLVLLFLCIMLGFMTLPVRPMYIGLGIFYVFWFSSAIGFIVTGLAYERPIVERLVHPATYFSMPLSGAFVPMSWIPDSVRSVMLWWPMPHMFEMIRHGAYENQTLEYVDFTYVTICCMVATLIGLISLSIVKDRLHAAS